MSNWNKAIIVLDISFAVYFISNLIFTPDLSEIQKALELGLVLQTSHFAYTRLYNKEESL